jgi:hypothetical protein
MRAWWKIQLPSGASALGLMSACRKAAGRAAACWAKKRSSAWPRKWWMTPVERKTDADSTSAKALATTNV